MELTGQIERVTFTSEETGYTVARVKVYGQHGYVTVVGNIMSPTPGEILRMTGEWARHPSFGDQFKIKSYKTEVPATVYGIQKYLGSGLVKGLGPKMAARIVKKFGKETLEVIEHQAERLSSVPFSQLSVFRIPSRGICDFSAFGRRRVRPTVSE